MSCKSCSTGGCGSVKVGDSTAVAGCQSNGACGTSGCNKMNVFDWLSNMDVPQTMRFNIVEIKFKGGRKEYFRNINNLELYTGDFVLVDMPTGYHIGSVSLQGELVRLQMIKKSIKENDEIKNIQRKATERDMDKHEQAIARDLPTMYRSREISKDLKLQMKLSDVEFQSDNTKATFYYSAEDRVDFRELIKTLAGEFKIRVEMKQISLRQEAARVGGIGSCGRELCCSTWLTDFRNIPTSAARYQNLSLNPTKLSGQCGRLKCCLNYELETYMDALSDVPAVEKSLKTQKGDAYLQKTDIFRKIMWFSYQGGGSDWVSISMVQVVEIQKMNERNELPLSLEDLLLEASEDLEKATGINSDLARLDKKYSNNKGKSKSSNVKAERSDRNERFSRRNDTTENRSNENQATIENRQPEKPQGNRNDRSKNTPNRQGGNQPLGNKPTNERQPQEVRPNVESRQDRENQQGNKPANERQPQGNRPNNENRQGGNSPQSNKPTSERVPQNVNRPNNEIRQNGNQPQGNKPTSERVPQNANRPNVNSTQTPKPVVEGFSPASPQNALNEGNIEQSENRQGGNKHRPNKHFNKNRPNKNNNSSNENQGEPKA